MNIQLGKTATILCTALMLSACATSPEAVQQREQVDAQINKILSEPLEEEQPGKPKRCLADHEYRNFKALDERHILFEGRGDKQWINTLRSRCPDLRHGEVLRVRSFSAIGRICEYDSFAVDDWFDWPWYRRWPWRWGETLSAGMTCTMGKFQPVTEQQVWAIKDVTKTK